MDFFDKLQTKTQAARDELLNIDFIKKGYTGDLSKESYVAFLEQAYHHVKHTTPLLMACGGRIPSKMEWLRNVIAEYIEEELGHQEWILNDIKACGYDAEKIRNSTPGLAAEVLVAYAYDIIQRRNPVGFLGMVLVLEGTSIKIATQAAQKLQTNLGLPDTAFSYLTSHGSLDISHMNFYQKQVNRISNQIDQDFIIHTAKIFYKLYGNVFRALPS